MTVRVIEATGDRELGEKVANAINLLSMIPFSDWQYNNGLYQVLVMSGTASGEGAFTLLYGSSSAELGAQRDKHTEDGWQPFGSIKYIGGKYVQALARGVPSGGGGGTPDVYVDNIVDATALGKSMLHAALPADVHELLGAGVAGLAVYGMETPEDIKTYLDIQVGNITADQITDATTVGKAVLRATTTSNAQIAIGGSNVGRQVFTASNGTAAQTAIGGGTTGRNVFSASQQSDAVSALGCQYDALSALKTLRYGGFTPRDLIGTGGLGTLTIGTTGFPQTGARGYLTVSSWDAVSVEFRQPALFLRRWAGEGAHTRLGLGVATSAVNQVGIASYEDIVLIQRAYNTNVDTVTVNADMTTRSVAPNEDANRDLGASALRYNNIYLANQPVVTSDGRLKINKDYIGDAVLDAWAEIDYIQFRNTHGDRLHFGVLAQKVKETFEAHGLDPFAYGLMCYDEWDAVPAHDAEYDDEGVLIKEASEAIPAGNRYGIRYNECLVLEAALMRRTIKRLQSGA